MMMMTTTTRAMGAEKPCVFLGSNTIISSRGHKKNSKKNVVGLIASSSSSSYSFTSTSSGRRRRMLLGIHSGGGGGSAKEEEERRDGNDERNSSNSSRGKPVAAEVSRTIMELSSVATLSVLTTHPHPHPHPPQEESDQLLPLGFGVRFAVDHQGTPFFSLNHHQQQQLLFSSSLSTLHVQLEQCGLRTPQCTIQGTLARPHHQDDTKKLQSIWLNRFQEQLHQDLLYILSVQRVLQIEDFMEDGVWFTSSEYKSAVPDPLRDSAEHIIHEINTHHMEDIHRFCNIFVDLSFQVSDAKMVWVDRLGFDMRLSSPQNDVFEVRIPFPREVADEKGAKSSFNCMSQLAWEMDKNYRAHDFNKVKQLKKITRRAFELN